MTSRRRFLGGAAGTAIALPLLESLLPRAARAATPPKRFVVLYFPNGWGRRHEWNVRGTGPGYEMGDSHASLAEHRADLTFVTNLHNRYVSGTPAHARACAGFLAAARVSDDSKAVARVAGPSADQIIAGAIAGDTPIPSLHLGPSPYPKGAEPNDTGWPSTYLSCLSWRSPEVSNPSIESPAAVFDKLFPGRSVIVNPAKRRLYQKSILDYATKEIGALSHSIGRSDRAKLDQYLTGLRDVEVRIGKAKEGAEIPADLKRPPQNPNFPEHTALMFDLVAAAFAADLTRVVTYQIDHEFGMKDFAFLLGGTGAIRHHDVTHTENEEAYDRGKKITTWYVEQFASLVKRLKNVREGEGSLLRNSLVLFGSSLGNGFDHSGANLPICLAGANGGQLATGRAVDGAGRSHEELVLGLMHALGARAPTFGAATTALPGL